MTTGAEQTHRGRLLRISAGTSWRNYATGELVTVERASSQRMVRFYWREGEEIGRGSVTREEFVNTYGREAR